MEKKRIGVVLPCINLWDKYTKPAIDSIKSNNHELFIIVIDNGSTDNTRIGMQQLCEQGTISRAYGYIRNLKNEGCSVAWNQGIQLAIKESCDYILVINNDVLLHPKAVDNLVDRFSNSVDDQSIGMVTMINVRGDCKEIPENIYKLDDNAYRNTLESEHPDFSGFMIKKDTYIKVGPIDEGYAPAYFEDNDYHRRIDLSGLKAINHPPALFYHYGSKTRQESGISVVSDWQFRKNGRYYIYKWGGEPAPKNTETHKHPFNDPQKPVTWTYQNRCKEGQCKCRVNCNQIMKTITG